MQRFHQWKQNKYPLCGTLNVPHFRFCVKKIAVAYEYWNFFLYLIVSYVRSDVMKNCVSLMVNHCLQKGYITNEQAPWLQYGLEKRLSTIFGTVSFLIFGFLVSSVSTTLSCFISFCILRCRTNGYHAKTVWGCFFSSLLWEYLFLVVLGQMLNTLAIFCFLLASALTIYFLAPYKHPNLRLSDAEVSACAKSAKIRLCILLLTNGLVYWLDFYHVWKGISLGVGMAATMLTFAYLQNGRILHEKAN